MQFLLDAALADPWGTLDRVVDGPLHPGGREASEALLDRAAVSGGTRLVDLGCGAGESVALARRRGARAVGIDREPGGERTVIGDMQTLPVRDGSVDVVLAECSLCLSPDVAGTLAESRRVLADGGRLALSDVVLEGDPPDVPDRVAEALCLTGARQRAALLDRIEAAGFDVADVRDHREDLLAMRDQLEGRVDYRGLLGAMGERGSELLAAVERLEAAVESGRVGYVSLVADADRAPRA